MNPEQQPATSQTSLDGTIPQLATVTLDATGINVGGAISTVRYSLIMAGSIREFIDAMRSDRDDSEAFALEIFRECHAYAGFRFSTQSHEATLFFGNLKGGTACTKFLEGCAEGFLLYRLDMLDKLGAAVRECGSTATVEKLGRWDESLDSQFMKKLAAGIAGFIAVKNANDGIVSFQRLLAGTESGAFLNYIATTVFKGVTLVSKEQLSLTAATLGELLAAVSEVTGTLPQALKNRGRRGPVAEARKLFCWFANKELHATTGAIGRFLGDRDHSTVISAVRSIDRLSAEDPRISYQLSRIEAILLGHITSRAAASADSGQS